MGGFSTTRFVEQDSANGAIERVFEIVKAELSEMGFSTNESTLELDEIREDDELFDLYAPGGGYTFYVGDDE